MFGCADFETYGSGAITRWRIVTRKQQCNHCEQMFEANLNEYKIQCSTCKDRFREIRGNLSPEERDVWLRPYKVARREQRDLAQNSRWVREFAAKGSFTRAQFKELCAAYGKVCLCCRGKGPLVPDHVIPLESQGSNDITNIQPLCKRCNSRKGTKDTDYRLKHRRR
jgi:5-methylcytosine-specific restriction endonuclease McrA